MDIKLSAKLTAYSRVETFEKSSTGHECDMVPLPKESIDKLFNEAPEIKDALGKDFIDSLF